MRFAVSPHLVLYFKDGYSISQLPSFVVEGENELEAKLTAEGIVRSIGQSAIKAFQHRDAERYANVNIETHADPIPF